MDDHPPNPTHQPTNPLEEIMPQQTEVVDDRNKRETEKMVASQQTEMDEEKKKTTAVNPSAIFNSSTEIDQAPPALLFQKTLDSEDVDPSLNRVVIRSSRDVMVCALATAQEFKKSENGNIRVTAWDSNGVEYELKFMRYRDGSFVLRHQWSDVVTVHGLREGDIVVGWGNVIGDCEFGIRLNILKIAKSRQSAQNYDQGWPEKSMRKSGNDNKIDQVVMFLFQKELESEDANPKLNRLVIERFKDVMTRALATAEKKLLDHVRVTTTDPKGVEYQLRFMRNSDGRYVLHHQWSDIVTAHGLLEGDIVAGWGNVVGDDEIRMKLDIFEIAARSGESGGEESEADEDNVMILEELVREKDELKGKLGVGEPCLLLSKQLESPDTNAILNRVVVSFCNDMMRESLERAREVKKSDHVEVLLKLDSSASAEYKLEFKRYYGGTYAVFGWGEVVTANRLKRGDTVAMWGDFVAEDQVRCVLHIIAEPDSREHYIP